MKNTNNGDRSRSARPPANPKPKLKKKTMHDGLTQEKQEHFKSANIRKFEALAKSKGVSLEELLSAGIKTYLQREAQEQANAAPDSGKKKKK